jgi:hypothetical protein
MTVMVVASLVKMGSEQDTDLLPADSMLWPINTRRQPMSHGVPSFPAGRSWCPYRATRQRGF